MLYLFFEILLECLFQNHPEDRCKEKIPYWLAYGIAALKIDWKTLSFSREIPSLDHLEMKDIQAFSDWKGHHVCCAFAKFIQDTYGWETILQLLSNYELYKEKFYNYWVQSQQKEAAPLRDDNYCE